ncbi:GNAT family N-acetyltransferase [Brevibacillus centrosporus]|uniref:GNAT family N-acetyltransferase n=1 Tax=Brevibacillus centrosporus TaxID=54910 RepID=UPI0038160A15
MNRSNREGFAWNGRPLPALWMRWKRPKLPGTAGITSSLLAAVSRLKKPLSRRKNGYASTCVAILSQQLLDAGYQFCSLYTDLANPTSNRIYQAIGYRPIQDSVVLRFDR